MTGETTRYVALLRGINLGKVNRIAMADLRHLLSGLGYADVKTHLQSGNVVFSHPHTSAGAIEAEIRRAVMERFDLDVSCLVRSRDELHAVVAAHPLADVATNGSRMMALFLSRQPDPKLLAAHDPVALDPDRVRVGDRVIYQWCPDGLMKAPPVGSHVERHLKVSVTARNWNTVTKLADLLDV